MSIVMKYLFVLISLTGCIHNYDAEETKSPLNHLNGENYALARHQNQDAGLIPLVLHRKARISKISGTLMMTTGFIPAPLGNQTVFLTHKKTGTVTQTVSQPGGSFSFVGNFKNGSYQLSVDSKRLQGSLSFEVRTYNTHNLNLLVSPP